MEIFITETDTLVVGPYSITVQAQVDRHSNINASMTFLIIIIDKCVRTQLTYYPIANQTFDLTDLT